MIDFYSFAPEIFILVLILISITLGILNKDATISINTTGFTLLTIFLILKGQSLYRNSLFSLNTINLILLSKIILSIGSIIFILLSRRSLKNENLFRYEYILFILFAILGGHLNVGHAVLVDDGVVFLGPLFDIVGWVVATVAHRALPRHEGEIQVFPIGMFRVADHRVQALELHGFGRLQAGHFAESRIDVVDVAELLAVLATRDAGA